MAEKGRAYPMYRMIRFEMAVTSIPESASIRKQCASSFLIMVQIYEKRWKRMDNYRMSVLCGAAHTLETGQSVLCGGTSNDSKPSFPPKKRRKKEIYILKGEREVVGQVFC